MQRKEPRRLTPAELRERRDRQQERAKKRLTRGTLRVLARMAAANGATAKKTEWENEFLKDVSGRLATYGSAFADPEKGILGQPLSFRQNRKLKEIERKTRKPKDASATPQRNATKKSRELLTRRK